MLIDKYIDIIGDLSRDCGIGFEYNNLNVKLTTQQFTVQFDFTIDSTIKYTARTDTFESKLFCNILNKIGDTTLSYQVIQSWFTIIKNLMGYCVGCFNLIGCKTIEFTHCGLNDCKYKLENLLVDNYVCDYIKNSYQTVELLLLISAKAANSHRANQLFDPFPNYFLKNEINVQRGNLAILSMETNEYAALSVAKRLDDIKYILNTDLTSVLDYALKVCDDKLLMKSCGSDVYYLIRFILKSSNITVNLYKQNEHLKIYKIKNSTANETKFKQHSDITKNGDLLYHGSSIACWHSIIRNGLKVMSNTTMMTAGAAFGSGIYMSDKFCISHAYCGGGDQIIMGVYEIASEKQKFSKSSDIYVIPSADLCLLRYLIVIDKGFNDVGNQVSGKASRANKSISWVTSSMATGKTLGNSLDKLFSEEICLENMVNKHKMTDKQIKRLSIEITKVRQKYVVDQDENNWYVHLNHQVTLHIIFPSSYPFNPPFIYVLSPIFKECDNITKDGALCYEYITQAFWSPCVTMETIITQLDIDIIAGSIDKISHEGTYSKDLAEKSYEQLALVNKWII